MAEPTTPTASSRPIDPNRLARAAFALSVVSVIVYFVTSEGIHHFVAFLLETAAKVVRRRS